MKPAEQNGLWQRYVDSFDHEVAVRSTCHPLPVTILVVVVTSISFTLFNVEFLRQAVGLRDWIPPSILVLAGGVASIIGWASYPNRSWVAATQLIDVPLYGATAIALAALSEGLAVYAFALVWMQSCIMWGSTYALTLIGALSCLAGPFLTAAILGLPPAAWMIMVFTIGVYFFASKAKKGAENQVAKYRRSGEVLESIDRLLETSRRDSSKVVQAHTTALLHEAKNELTPASWNLDVVANNETLTNDERQALSESKTSIDETIAAIQGILDNTRTKVEEDTAVWLPDLVSVLDLPDDDPANHILEIVDLPAVAVHCPAAYLRIAIKNLLDNAVEARATRIELRGRISSTTSTVVVTISDNGPGLPDQVKKKLFKPFNTHNKTGGVGLGIYLSKRLAEAVGGELRLDLANSKGTVMSLALPLANPENDPHVPYDFDHADD